MEQAMIGLVLALVTTVGYNYFCICLLSCQFIQAVPVMVCNFFHFQNAIRQYKIINQIRKTRYHSRMPSGPLEAIDRDEWRLVPPGRMETFIDCLKIENYFRVITLSYGWFPV